jgi:hypothetical protein
VRKKRVGFQKISPGQLRQYATLNSLFDNLESAVKDCHLIGEDIIFECKRLGTREELQKKLQEPK